MLLFLFAFGISLDLKNINVGIADECGSSYSKSLVDSFSKSGYFKVISSNTRSRLLPLLKGGRLNALLIIPKDFEKRLFKTRKNAIQIIVSGTDANSGALLLNYIRTTFFKWIIIRNIPGSSKNNGINIESRVWYNSEIESRATLLPGSIAIIIILIGTMLTSLVVAREWERGTMEALLATSVTRVDILFGKFIPYFILGIIASMMVSAISIYGFQVPFRGSFSILFILVATYLSFALGLGLLISTLSKNQFIATMVALIVGFLPSFILSGIVFEISSMPLPIRTFTFLLPPRYFVSSIRTIFLAGNVWNIIIPNLSIISLFAIFFLSLTIINTRTDLEKI